jgi:hypothetical protein
MASPKTRKTIKSKSPRATSIPTPVPSKTSSRKVVAAIIGSVLLLFLVWLGLHSFDEGPKTPLPRVAATCPLGASYEQIKALFPKIDLRSYNDDPDFKIASLKSKDKLPENLTGLDLIFFKGTLFFVSQVWETPNPQKDLDVWAHQYRRWLRKGDGNLQSLGENATLREWNFHDPSTEMILRELKYNNRTEHWQDLRDGANIEGQKAFAKHRIDA